MNMFFNSSLTTDYKSNSQKIRVMSETWINDNMYCPCCGNPHITHLKNNSPVADFKCDSCGEIFELKSKKGQVGNKINDGSYTTMINRITSDTNPDLLILQYSDKYKVCNLTLIPKFFFVPDTIEKRKPLEPTARRAGWIGCNILYRDIPNQGKIQIINNSKFILPKEVIKNYEKAKQLKVKSIDSRGWLMDILNCINAIHTTDFVLNDVYDFINILQSKHPENHNIEAKIRQQLQMLRDNGVIEFLGNGHYRKL